MTEVKPGEVRVTRGPRRYSDGRLSLWRGWYVEWCLPHSGPQVTWCYTRCGAHAVANRKRHMVKLARGQV